MKDKSYAPTLNSCDKIQVMLPSYFLSKSSYWTRLVIKGISIVVLSQQISTLVHGWSLSPSLSIMLRLTQFPYDIRWIVLRNNLRHIHQTMIHYISYELQSDVNVLCSLIMHSVSCKVQSTLTITTDFCLAVLPLQLSDYPLEPFRFFYCFSGRHIFSFGSA